MTTYQLGGRDGIQRISHRGIEHRSISQLDIHEETRNEDDLRNRRLLINKVVENC